MPWQKVAVNFKTDDIQCTMEADVKTWDTTISHFLS